MMKKKKKKKIKIKKKKKLKKKKKKKKKLWWKKKKMNHFAAQNQKGSIEEYTVSLLHPCFIYLFHNWISSYQYSVGIKSKLDANSTFFQLDHNQKKNCETEKKTNMVVMVEKKPKKKRTQETLDFLTGVNPGCNFFITRNLFWRVWFRVEFRVWIEAGK